MSKDRCEDDIFRNGQSILLIDGRSGDVERWVQEVAKQSGVRVDWHYSGGVAQVLYLGDARSRSQVEAAIRELEPQLRGTILRRLQSHEKGLYRRGVTQVPPGALAAFYDSGKDGSAYIIEVDKGS